MRRVNTLILLLFLPSLACAGPHPVSWIKHHPAVGRIVLYGAAIASTVESAHQINLCRDRVDLARCNGGYGEVGAREVTNGVFTGGMIVLSEWGHHKHFSEWFLPVAAVATYNGITAFQQSQIGGSGVEKDNHSVNLTPFIRH